MVTPHVATDVLDEEGKIVKHLNFPEKEGFFFSKKLPGRCAKFWKASFQKGLEECVPRGYSIGGKTATSQTLPRSANRYISVPRLHPGGASDGAGALHYPQSAGRSLRRNDLRAGDPRYLFQCTSVSRWTHLRKPENCGSFAALVHLKFCFAKEGCSSESFLRSETASVSTAESEPKLGL